MNKNEIDDAADFDNVPISSYWLPALLDIPLVS
jgi:hypothetical protein